MLLQLQIPEVMFVLKNYSIAFSLRETIINMGICCNFNMYVWHVE